MRPRFGRQMMLRLMLCLAALVLLPRCGRLTTFQLSPLTSPLPMGEETPGDGPDAGPIGQIEALLDQVSGGLGRLVLLLVLLAAVLVLLVAFIVLLVRARARDGRRAAPVSSPTPPVAPEPQTSTGTTRELPPAVARATLVLEAPGDAGEVGTYTVSITAEGFTIGRSPNNDLVIDTATPGSESVSRQHARIVYVGGRWILEDLDSQNGVYVNGRRTGRNVLRDGWKLAIGGVQAVFHIEGGEVAS